MFTSPSSFAISFADVRLCLAVLCGFGTDRARAIEALLPERRKGKVLHVLA